MGQFPNPDSQFKAGGPGGPGRPKSKTVLDRLREVLEDESRVDAIVAAWVADAELGNHKARKELLDRLHGKVSDRVEHDGQIRVIVEYADGEAPAPAAPPGAGGDPGEPGPIPGPGVRPEMG